MMKTDYIQQYNSLKYFLFIKSVKALLQNYLLVLLSYLIVDNAAE